MTAGSDTGTVQHDPPSAKAVVERRCVLWVHDEAFSKEEVVLNLDLFPDVNPGDVMAIMALKTDSGVRDFQEMPQTTKREGEALPTPMQRERSASNSGSPGPTRHGSDARHDVEHGNRYLFVAKDMPTDLKAKQATLEISIAKHIADAFGLKHRSNVLLSTVCLS